ncbi:MAG: 16S rRNA (cytosine(1402)-N(4))-methyltransferase RsmH [Propionibacteriaceae bacterium]|nr:16S rRNA (cytosine(1402)-N(4))-methyltransferase RsmH [Micropruina sp.]
MAAGTPATHVPVLCARVVELLAVSLQAPGAIYVDCTLGLGGHALAVLQACPGARLIGIDRDTDALDEARRRLAPVADRVELYQAIYHELPEVLAEAGVPKVSAILADLGLSSLQIDRRERGFAYSVDAPLDMRMDASEALTAAQIVNTWPAPRLVEILRRFGEERFADRIVRAIIAEREREPFDSSARLVTVISSSIPVAAQITGGHPAKRTFQALRIAVNGELDSLAGLLPEALDALAPGGRFAVLAYHSLEDRAVKTAFREASTDRAPRDMPLVPEALQARFRLVTRGAERPGEAEQEENPRAASARLRVIERTREAA